MHTIGNKQKNSKAPKYNKQNCCSKIFYLRVSMACMKAICSACDSFCHAVGWMTQNLKKKELEDKSLKSVENKSVTSPWCSSPIF